MAKVCWPYFDPEYENLSVRINPPRFYLFIHMPFFFFFFEFAKICKSIKCYATELVSVDNTSCSDCTLIKVDSVNKPGILLEVVQILSDLDFIITKAYVSSDGGWFMDDQLRISINVYGYSMFHVTDQQGKKITDGKTIDYIERVCAFFSSRTYLLFC
ncbi:ACT domain-containing protein ACR3-like isoform X2 [Gossypium australe]|uniref:ACT domain-containing protein ACR n=1 Tax=Gossypium australe TaxID=47621 RepID=A0A5B6WSY9_9ROSI|nr:ACT domain-containing protein ACR3-like isoform X2 [Gossypium australe]